MNFLGIDGCRGGWVVAEISSAKVSLKIAKSLSELLTLICSCKIALIDIPLGFPDRDYRQCDLIARKILGRRRSSIFLLPLKSALLMENYEEACDLNYAHMGVKFSRQIWNIRGKVIEANGFVVSHKLQGRIRESHPEICFWALNSKRICKYSKKTTYGIKERKDILSRYLDLVGLEEFLNENRTLCKMDDILDSLVLSVSATYYDRLKSIPSYPDFDRDGIIREIVYPEI